MAFDPEDKRPILFTGGKVLVMDGKTPSREAAVVRDGHIQATGSAADMLALAGRDHRTVDVAGATVMPGLIDTHPHMLHFAAREYTIVTLFDAVDHNDIVERIRAKAKTTPKGQWILCSPIGEPHYFIRRSFRDLPERCLPDRHVLDRATTDHPVHIQAWAPTTPNVCAFNSAGLHAIGVSSFIPDKVCDVTIEKDDAGELTGIMRGAVNNYYCFDPYWTQILLKMPGPATWELHDSVIEAMGLYNRQGVTTVYEGHNMRDNHVRAYKRLREENALSVRVMSAMDAETYAYPPFRPASMDAFRANLEVGLSLVETEDPLFRMTGMSFSPGAPMGPGTIRMYEPYEGPFGEPTRGPTFLSLEKQQAFIEFCAEKGLRANFVVAGYRDTDDVIQGLKQIAAKVNVKERRWLIQHALVISEAQARALHDFGCDFTTCIGFCWGKGDLYGERGGTHLWRDLTPIKRLLNIGLKVGCGSDWGPKNAWEQIQLGETHAFCGSGHHNDTPDHKLTREESLLTWTRDAAEVLGWKGIGTLETGNHADMIVVDGDPLTCRTEDLPGMRVLSTMLGGQGVFDGGNLFE
jgi:predicted amidohydrolase YtcJ